MGGDELMLCRALVSFSLIPKPKQNPQLVHKKEARTENGETEAAASDLLY